MFGEPGAWRPSEDLLQKTSEGVETLVRLGDEVASFERRRTRAGKSSLET
jgi:hypothetical protein